MTSTQTSPTDAPTGKHAAFLQPRERIKKVQSEATSMIEMRNDLDLLIEKLQAEDGTIEEHYEQDEGTGVARNDPVSDNYLDTDPSKGLNNEKVETRRRKWGLNQMTEEKSSPAWKFFGFFIGPTPFIMEASQLLKSLT